VFVQSLEEPVEVGSGVAPVEGNRGLLVASLEAQEAALDLDEVTEVVGESTLRWITEK